VRMYPKSVTIAKFKTFLEELRQLHFADNIAVFLDQHIIHTSKKTTARYEELGIEFIPNAAYSPNYQPIENIFALVKARFKKKRLQDLLDGRKEDVRENIRQSFASITINEC
jgi:transposase